MPATWAKNAPVSPSAIARERFTGAQIVRLVELGLISEDADFELKDTKEKLTNWLGGFPLSFNFSVETTLSLNEHSVVEPDFVLYPAYVSIKVLRPTDVLLTIDVAGSSLSYDLTVKAPRQAAAGIQEYWVINAAKRSIRVFRGPGATGWAEMFDVAAGAPVGALCAPGLEVAV